LLKKLRKVLGDYEVLMLVVMSVFVISFMINVKDNPRAGRLFPTYIGLVTLCLIAIESIITFKKRRKGPAASEDALPEKGERNVDWPQHGLVAKFVGLIFLYYIGILAVGYLIASLLFLLITMYILGVKSKMEILLISLGTLAVIYVVFTWGFSFILPTGLVF